MTAITTAPAAHTTRVTGTVRWFSPKGFGFIDRTDGGDIYVHHSGIAGTGFTTLADGARVSFEVRQTARGPEAVGVVTLG